MRKRILSLMLTIIMLVSMCIFSPASVNAATSGNCGDNLKWTLSDDGTLTISGTGEMGNYTSSTYYPWYNHRNSVRKIIIDNGVTSIGVGAFSNFEHLTNITIADSVVSIGNSAFWCCISLKSITIPNGVERIESNTFYNCTKLASIVIPNSVNHLDSTAFTMCYDLDDIYYAGTKDEFCKIVKYHFMYSFMNSTTIHCNWVDKSTQTKPQLATPKVTVTKATIKVGEIPEFHWDRVPNADFYTIWDWTREEVYDNVTQTSVDSHYMSISEYDSNFGPGHNTQTWQPQDGGETFAVFRPYTKPGTYAIGVYARDSRGKYAQSESYSFNITVLPAESENQGSFSPTPQQHKPGDIINKAIYTDIKAYFSQQFIPSYNIDGYTGIIAEDLRYFGFDVDYYNSTRSLYITYDGKDDYNKMSSLRSQFQEKYSGRLQPTDRKLVGTKAADVYYTDIKTYVDGKLVTSYNIGGETIIFIDDLAPYGTVRWNPEDREIYFSRYYDYDYSWLS